MIKPMPNKLIIEGITPDGQKFRPSDWAERMSGNLSTFKNQRIHYSPLLYPSTIENRNCLIVSLSLAEANPPLFEQIIAFAQKNRLSIVGEIPAI